MSNIAGEPVKEMVDQETPAIVASVRKELMQLSAEGKPEDMAEILTLEQVENDLTANPFVARALDAHLREVTNATKTRVLTLNEPVQTAWDNVIGSASGAGVLTEVTRDYPIRGGYGDKERLVSIAALENDYPTETSKEASHFTDSNEPAAYSLGREVGHDGKGTIFFTEGAFRMLKTLSLKKEGLI